MSSPVLTAFGLQTQEAALARAFVTTGATIHGGAALSWFTGTAPPPGQDIDIWCRPAEPILYPLIRALYDTIFRAAGYHPVSDSHTSSSSSYYAKFKHIAHIHNWHSFACGRKIQLIIRKPDAPPNTTDDFDLDICQIAVVPMPRAEGLVALPPATLSPNQIANRIMQLRDLTGQSSANTLKRVRKYYDRGFAFESTEATCSCPCGTASHRTVTAPRRMTLEEGLAHVSKSWATANPLSNYNPHRADNLQRYLQRADNAIATKPLRQLEEELLACRIANDLLQNQVHYSRETDWIVNYVNTVITDAIRIKHLEMDWAETRIFRPSTTFCARILRDCERLLEKPHIKDRPALLEIVRNLHERAQQALTAPPVLDVVEPVPVPSARNGSVKKPVLEVLEPTTDPKNTIQLVDY